MQGGPFVVGCAAMLLLVVVAPIALIAGAEWLIYAIPIAVVVWATFVWRILPALKREDEDKTPPDIGD